MSPLTILLSTGFTGCVCLAAGLLGFEWLRLRLHKHEVWPLAFVFGSALLSAAVFAIMTLQLANPWTFGVFGVCIVVAAIRRRAWPVDASLKWEPVPQWWKLLLGAGILAYGLYTFAHALAPEVSPDGTAYHLGNVNKWLRDGGWRWHTTNMYANLPMGIEMLFLFAYSFGRHSAAALVHWQFYLVVPFLVLSLGRRFGFTSAGAAAALLVFAAPVAGIDGASAYVDLATAAVVLATVYVLLLWEHAPDSGLLPLAGILAGFAYACKMTVAPIAVFAVLYTGFIAWRRKQRLWKPVLTVALLAGVMIAPWLIKNALMVGNPLSPFLNRYFPNPYIRISFEEEYRALHRTYYGNVPRLSQVPLEVTVKGAHLNGLLGPVFLLSPLALLALRWPLGRRLLAAAVIVGSTYFGNIGTRFLLTILPLVALPLCMVLSQARGVVSAAVLFHLFLSWPSVIPVYSDQYAWRLDRFRWRAAWRLESERGFIDRYCPNCQMAELVERKVPPHGRVLTMGSVAEAYTSRPVHVSYQSGFNNVAGEILFSGIVTDYHPTQIHQFRFGQPRPMQKFRIVQTNAAPDLWNVSEIRAYRAEGAEIPRTNTWRIRSDPNPWDVQMAFDNCPLTRWRSWESARPGHYIEVDLGYKLPFSMVRVEASPDQQTALELHEETSNGFWKRVDVTLETLSVPPLDKSRAIASDDLKRLGFTHVAINHSDFIGEDLYRNRRLWRMRLVGETPHARLYAIE
ncbi:MAG TPA: glycosyltransferase family 39 protein [Bryobacteraceae bacterium]|nr:glycosyltransferase family 39 protein [Bryobacteraceae bacterium]